MPTIRNNMLINPKEKPWKGEEMEYERKNDRRTSEVFKSYDILSIIPSGNRIGYGCM